MNIFYNTFKERRLSTTIYSIGLAIFAFLFAALYQSSAGQLEMFADSIPEGFQAFIGDLSEKVTPESWLSLELYAFFAPLILVVIGIGAGSRVIGGDEESGAIELLLAKPMSRFRIYIEKSMVLFCQCFIVAMSILAGVFIGSLIFPFDVNYLRVFEASINIFLLGVLFGCLSLFLQNVFKSRRKALGITSGIYAVTYFAYIISKLVDYLEILKYFSPAYYLDAAPVLSGNLNWSYLGSMTGIMLLFWICGLFIFKRRDVGV